MPGKRIPTRGKRTGSVRIVTPKKLMSIVECPSHASVSRVSLHFDGSGLAKAGAILRQLSIVHSLNRCPSHRRTLDPRGTGCCGACTSESNTAMMAAGRRLEGCAMNQTDTRLSFLRLAKQSFDRFPQRSSWLGRSGAGDEDRHIRSIQNIPG